MKEYMFIFIGADYQELGLSPEEIQKLMGQWFAWIDELKAKMVQGRLGKWLQATCLLSQPYLLADSGTVASLLERTGNGLDSAITVSRFARFELGV